MKEHEFDELDTRLRNAYCAKGMIETMRAFLSRDDFNKGSPARVIVRGAGSVQPNSNLVTDTIFEIPLGDLLPFLREYAENRLEKAIKELDSL